MKIYTFSQSLTLDYDEYGEIYSGPHYQSVNDCDISLVELLKRHRYHGDFYYCTVQCFQDGVELFSTYGENIRNFNDLVEYLKTNEIISDNEL